MNHSPVPGSTGPRVHEPRVHESGSTGQRTAENRTGPGFSQGENSSSNSSENLFKSTSFFQLQGGGYFPAASFRNVSLNSLPPARHFFILPPRASPSSPYRTLPPRASRRSAYRILPPRASRGANQKYFHYQIPWGTNRDHESGTPDRRKISAQALFV